MNKRNVFTPLQDDLYETSHNAIKLKLEAYVREYGGRLSLMADCLYIDRRNLSRLVSKYDVDVGAIRAAYLAQHPQAFGLVNGLKRKKAA